ncbi:MAG: HAMP domain-containing protein, partial [Acidobacteria bacterium]|nr:HAMP domain-containing protein [Acidobacteriota bacterium]
RQDHPQQAQDLRDLLIVPLAYRIAAGFSILLVIMLALAGYHLSLLHRQSVDIFEISAKSRAVLEAALEIRAQLIDLSRLSDRLKAYEALEETELGGSAEDYHEKIERVRASVSKRVKIVKELDLPEEQAQEAELLERIWQEHLKRVGLREIRGTLSEPATSPRSAVNQGLQPTEHQLKRLQAAAKNALNEQGAAVNANVRQAELAAQVAAIVALVSALAGSLVVGRTILRPLRRVAKGARALAEGDFTYRVPESGGEEIAALARDFNIMAARISQLDQLKKDLISNVSHDLKAPLASMQETTRLLLEALPGPLTEQQSRLLTLNLSSGERLSRMISDLLDLSRLEAGVETPSFERLDLGKLLRVSVEELENLLKERDQSFELKLPERMVEIQGVPTALGQVLTNLLSNALKFTPRGGALGARLEPFSSPKKAWWRRLAPSVREAVESSDGAGALLEIWDSGPGVPDDHKERVFQRFHRVDSHRRGAQGTGLGLAIAAAIVAQHHGALWVEDRQEGGSSFNLLLWRRVPPVEAAS